MHAVLRWPHAALASVVLLLAPAQDSWQDAWSLMEKGRYHAALDLLERAGETTDAQFLPDVLATVRAAVGDYAGAKECLGEATERTETEERSGPPLLDGVERLDALPAIVELARSHQVVILNEAHHVPETRPLTLAVARELREQGFGYLACEAFTPRIQEYAKKGYPTAETCGGYVTEPVFADLVRQAAKLGYELVHYETESPPGDGDTTDRINARENDQCRHLVERIFAKDLEARVLIHCGYSHATEDWRELPDGRELGWMAARLRRETGIDPLTIDQTRQRAAAVPEAGPPLWREAVRRGLVPSPTVFCGQGGAWLVEGEGWAGRVDLQVFHPATEVVDGRPRWLAMDGHRKPVEIPAELEPETDRLLIQAFVAEEGEDALPMDQVPWYAGDVCPVLLLPEGRYRVVAQDRGGDEVGRAECVSE